MQSYSFLSLRRISIAATSLSLLVSVGSFCLWLSSSNDLDPRSGLLRLMHPVTAVLMSFAGGSVLLACLSFRQKWEHAANRLTGSAVAGVGLYVVLSYLVGFSPLTETLLDPKLFAAGFRMPVQTAIAFLCLGIALVAISLKGHWKILAGIASLLILLTTHVVVLGFLYHSITLSGVSSTSSMAWLAILCFVLLSGSLLILNVEFGLVRLLSSAGLGGQVARRLLPVVIAAPTFIGWLRVVGQDLGFYDTAFGTALSMLAITTIMFVIVIAYSVKLSNADKRRIASEQELSRNERRYHELFDYSQGLICIHDVAGVVQAVNPAVTASLGYPCEEIVGRNISEFLPSEAQPLIGGFFRQIEHEGISNGLLPLVAKDGRRLTWRYQSILVADGENETYVIGNAIDVTELIAAQNELRERSLTDELTGLLNRRGFLVMAEQQIRLERHSRTARGMTLMFADMDGLKKINDSYGHEAGSDALQALARVVKSVVRSGDIVARLGGDEFVILSIGSNDGTTELVSDRIQRNLDVYNARSGKPYNVACSIGVAPVVLDGTRAFDEIIAEADQAMYEEKQRRKAVRREIPKIVQVSNPAPMPDSLAWY